MSDFDYEADVNLGEWGRSPGYFEERPANVNQQRKRKICPDCGCVIINLGRVDQMCGCGPDW